MCKKSASKHIGISKTIRVSEGEYIHVRPFNPKKRGQATDESSDAWDTIDWLVKNVPANNGKVGLFGISYPGFYTSMGMIDSHPALKAASPQAPVIDWFIGDDVHHNGAFFLSQNFNFFYRFAQRRQDPLHEPLEDFNWVAASNSCVAMSSEASSAIASRNRSHWRRAR